MKFNSASEMFFKNKIFPVFELHISAVFCEFFNRIGDFSYDNVVHLNAQFSNKQCTRRAFQGHLNRPTTRIKFQKVSLRNKLIRAFYILQSIKIQQACLKKFSQPAFKKFCKSFCKAYVFDNAEVFPIEKRPKLKVSIRRFLGLYLGNHSKRNDFLIGCPCWDNQHLRSFICF